jgi:hypothetical protein
MHPEERALLLAIAQFILDSSTHGADHAALRTAIKGVEATRRCLFDGNLEPCVHHSGQEAFIRGRGPTDK